MVVNRMAKFFYRMQNILNIKYKLETQAKTVYAAANEVLRQEELKLDLLYDDVEIYKNKIIELSNNILDVQELKWCNEAIEIKKIHIEQQKIEVKKAQRNLELARIKLNEVMVERKTHEKLKERAFEDFRLELEDSEKKEIDELVSFKFNKSK